MKPHAGFNANNDAEVLYKAMKGLGELTNIKPQYTCKNVFLFFNLLYHKISDLINNKLCIYTLR